ADRAFVLPAGAELPAGREDTLEGRAAAVAERVDRRGSGYAERPVRGEDAPCAQPPPASRYAYTARASSTVISGLGISRKCSIRSCCAVWSAWTMYSGWVSIVTIQA